MEAITANEIFERPRFRQGTKLQIRSGSTSVEYRDQCCDLEATGAEPELPSLLLSLLTGGKTIAELKNEYPKLATVIHSLIEDLDRQGLLTESEFISPSGTLSGHDFYFEIRASADQWMREKCKSLLFNGLKQNTLNPYVVIGYALEYFYLVRLAPGLIAPALAHTESISTLKRLQGFLASELNHDDMLMQSLEAVGIFPDDLGLMQPLPATFSLCASLGVYAKQHPLSFKALLFLFEMSSEEFNKALVEYCASNNLPAKFWEPLLRHAAINDELEHEDITYILLNEIEAICTEDQMIVMKNLLIAIETLALQEQQIIEYYSAANSLVPRVYK